ncbi:unannotated protein [freshwater metagenome]|uniref:Unannotated protein n=1 Tax=freshwater metagenome TaxID=449393 RepID=A0A6J6T9X5_9ZZZZ
MVENSVIHACPAIDGTIAGLSPTSVVDSIRQSNVESMIDL